MLPFTTVWFTCQPNPCQIRWIFSLIQMWNESRVNLGLEVQYTNGIFLCIDIYGSLCIQLYRCILASQRVASCCSVFCMASQISRVIVFWDVSECLGRNSKESDNPSCPIFGVEKNVFHIMANLDSTFFGRGILGVPGSWFLREGILRAKWPAFGFY